MPALRITSEMALGSGGWFLGVQGVGWFVCFFLLGLLVELFGAFVGFWIVIPCLCPLRCLECYLDAAGFADEVRELHLLFYEQRLITGVLGGWGCLGGVGFGWALLKFVVTLFEI